jgi:hypothetical protein
MICDSQNNLYMKNETKLMITVLALAVLFGGFNAVFAETNTDNSADASVVTRKDCIDAAKEVRVATVKSASDTAKTAKMNAKTTLSAYLAAVEANVDEPAATSLEKTVNDVYKASIKTIVDTQASAVKNAYRDYLAAIKSCPAK